jgi:hypothetical protein
MDRNSLFASLAALTGGLRPGPGVRDSDLEEARTLSAYEILRGRGVALTTARSLGDIPIADPDDPADASALLDIADSAIAGLAKDPNIIADVRIFRREHPILTAQLRDSVPPWAAGGAVERTLGPLLDAAGRPYWFDIRRILRQVHVTGGPGGAVLLVLPLTGLPLSGAN